jgi:hypothetical protein
MATPPIPIPKNYNVSDIKSSLLQPALTSHYEVYIPQPDRDLGSFIGLVIPSNQSDLLRISCSEASLPGSSLTTQELNDDYTGVTQRHAYRRLYDDRIDFTFYVNHTYDQIRFFERWMQFIVGEQIALKEPTTFFRVRYPKDYKRDLYIQKFERTARARTGKSRGGSSLQPPIVNERYLGEILKYEFIDAFPISINSMPVSYDSSQLLKCTVAFSYDRYIMSDVSTLASPTLNTNSNAPGVPELSRFSDPVLESQYKRLENPLSSQGYNDSALDQAALRALTPPDTSGININTFQNQ